MDQVYLFSVSPDTPATKRIAPGEAFTIEIRGAFDDVTDIGEIPTPFTPACEGHPLAPISGPVAIESAMPGDSVVVELIAGRSELSPEETYMLLGIVGELRVGTSPRPIMAARLIVPLEVLAHVGWRGLA